MEQNTISEDSHGPHGTATSDEFKVLIDNMNFMRVAVERTRRDFDPGTAVYITWGIVCLLGYAATHFLAAAAAYKQIGWVWTGLYAVGIPLSIFFGYRLYKKMMLRGVVPYIYVQIGLIWGIMILTGLVFGTFGLGRSFFVDINFLWAWVYATALCMTGLVYSREFLAGGAAIFAGILAAVAAPQYALLILGAVMCAGCIVPSLITLHRLHRAANENT